MIAATFFTFNMLVRSIGDIVYNVKYFLIDKKKYEKKIKKKCAQYAKEGNEMRKYL